MQDKNRYQLHVQPRAVKTWDVRPAHHAAGSPVAKKAVQSSPQPVHPVAKTLSKPASSVRLVGNPIVSRPSRLRPGANAIQHPVAATVSTDPIEPVQQLEQQPEPLAKHSRHTTHAQAKKSRRVSFKQLSLVASAVVLVGLSTFVGIDTWLTNQHVKGQAVMGASDNRANGDTHVKSQEGTDETPISAATLDDYKVAANMPRFLEIDKLGIKARILPMGVNSDNSVQAPINTNDSGWYTGSAQPGEVGASFIDGHASGATRLGLFGNLDRLTKGDQIKVEKGDGSVLTYSVVKVDIVPLDKVDMNQVLTPVAGTDHGLNLMTCSGEYVPKINNFNKRVIVYTKEITG